MASSHAGEYMVPAHVDDHAAVLLGTEQLGRLPGGEHRATEIHGKEEIQLLDVSELGS